MGRCRSSPIDSLILTYPIENFVLMGADSRSQSLRENSLHPSDEEKAAGNELVNFPEDDAGEFTIPDGGWRAWSVVLGSTLALFVSFGYVRIFICSMTLTHR